MSRGILRASLRLDHVLVNEHETDSQGPRHSGSMIWFLRLAILWSLPRLGKDPNGIRDLILEAIASC
jgi:hypothetical protein